MLITLNESGRLTATAETIEDMKVLLSLQGESEPAVRHEKTEQLARKPETPRKKHLHKKTCEICGRVLLGKRALHIHYSTMHGIRGEQSRKHLTKKEARQEFQEDVKALAERAKNKRRALSVRSESEENERAVPFTYLENY